MPYSITSRVVGNFSNTTQAKPPITTPRASGLRGMVIGGLARVVFEKFTTTSAVMRLPTELAQT